MNNNDVQNQLVKYLSENFEFFKQIVYDKTIEIPESLRNECVSFIKKQEKATREFEESRKQDRLNLEKLIKQSK